MTIKTHRHAAVSLSARAGSVVSRVAGIAAAGVLVLGLQVLPQPAFSQNSGGAQLPGGASSVQESFQDWQVSCAIIDSVKQCVMVQQQRQNTDNQLVLGVELNAPKKDGTVEGMLVLPFGMRLSSGITLQIDEQAALPSVAFSTCLPIGCLLPVSFDEATVAAARAGTSLKLSGVSNDGQPITFAVSLNGFAHALERLSKLGTN